MSEQSRLFVALILSVVSIFFYNYFFVQPKLDKAKQAQEAAKLSAVNTNVTTPDIQATLNIHTENKDKFLNEIKLRDRAEIIKEDLKNNKRVKFANDKVHASVNLRGGIIDDLTMIEFHEKLDKTSPEVALLSPKGSKNLYFLRTGFVSTNSKFSVPDESSEWKLDKSSSKDKIVLKYTSPEGLKFKKIISIDENYLITVSEEVYNASNEELSFLPFGLINRARPNKEEFYISHEGAISVADGVLEETTYEELVDEGKISIKKSSGWVGLTDKYWLTAILPQNLNKNKFDISYNYYQKNDQNRFQADILSGIYTVSPNNSFEYSFKIFAGAKKLNLLDKYSKQYDIPLFGRAIDFGSLYFLTKPIFKTLTYFHSHIGNFGLAILLLTICIRLILFPIANKAYKSTAMIKKHMPDIEKIKNKHKNDKQKASQEMMKYYKEHKINPMSGCLPMLVQIPVFFALYKVLYVTIEMRHAPFYGWIIDLSAKDPTNIFNLFGLFNYTPPAFLPALGVLPILFSLSMFIQQKLSPPPSDETQKLVISFMPWILLFVFAGFPAGLVVYWVWNNIPSIIQQFIITRRIEADKHA